jgi:2-pyrone-4,6-dicarboxylate lactonase
MNTQPPLTQPPDPNIKTPRVKCPEGAVDCHIHLFGPAAQYPFSPASRYISADALPETNIRMQDILGLSLSVIVSGGGYGADYTHLAHTLERFPDRFRGVALLPEEVSAQEIERLDSLGVRGARFVSPKHGGGLPQISPRIAALCHEIGWHVQAYPHGTEILEISDQLLALPNNLVLDHFAHIPAAGGADQPAVKRLFEMLDTGRVWVKVSGPMRCAAEDPPYSSVTPIARALIDHAPERILWGSDWPHVNMNNRQMPNDGDLLDLLLEWAPDETVRNRILRDNPREIYKLN